MKSLLLSPSHSLLSAKSFVQHLFKYPEGKEPERRMLSKSKKKKKKSKKTVKVFIKKDLKTFILLSDNRFSTCDHHHFF